MLLMLEKGQKIEREEITARLVDILYERNEGDFKRGTFRVRGDVIEIFPTYDDFAYRISLWGDEIESLEQIDPLTGQVKQTYLRLPIYPKTHYVMTPETRDSALRSIENELHWWKGELEKARQADRGAAPVAAHHVRSGDDPQHRLLPRHRELFAAFFGTPAGAGPADAAGLSAARCAAVPGRKPPDGSAACRACITATARARRTWSSSDSACPARWTIAR